MSLFISAGVLDLHIDSRPGIRSSLCRRDNWTIGSEAAEEADVTPVGTDILLEGAGE
jgi:hypothetical protein